MAIDLKATVMDTDGDMPYRNVNDIDDTPSTAFGRSVLNAANAAALRVLADSPSNAEAVLDTLYDANTILKADSDNTPAALTMGASTILARLAAGNIVAATPAELRTLLALVIGTNVQAWDADIDAIAALTSAADKVPYSTGAQAWALATLTSFARTLLDDADAATARVTLGLTGRIAFQRYTTADLTFNSTSWANAPSLGTLAVAAAVGDVLSASINMRANAEAVNLFMDVVTEVSATPTNSFGTGGAAPTSTTAEGVGAWGAPTTVAYPLTGQCLYTVQSGDISGGTVTARLRYRTATATNRTATASATRGVFFALSNLGPA